MHRSPHRAARSAHTVAPAAPQPAQPPATPGAVCDRVPAPPAAAPATCARPAPGPPRRVFANDTGARCAAHTSPAVAGGSVSEVAPPRPQAPSHASATPGASSAAGPGSCAQRRQSRLQRLDLLAQRSRSRDVGSKRLDLLVPGAPPPAGPFVQRPKATRRATLPHQLPALCLKLLSQRHAPRATRFLRRRADCRRNDTASRNDSLFTSRRHSSGIPESGISVQRRPRKSMPLQISAPRDNRTITRGGAQDI